MSLTQYSFLIVTFIVTGVLSAIVDLLFTGLLPSAFAEALLQQDAVRMNSEWFLTYAIFAIVILIINALSTVGLSLLRSWAPKLSLIVTLISLPFGLCMELAMSGLAATLFIISCMAWGAIWRLPFLHPLNRQKPSHQTPSHTQLA